LIVKNGLLSGVAAIALVAAAGASAPVAAQETFNWTGFYLGAHFGAGEADFSGIFKAGGSSDEVVDFDRLELSGVLGGGHAGYNWQRDSWVFGVEGDVSFMDWSDVAQAAESSDEGTGELDLLASIRGRIGITVDEQRKGLLYLTAGVAFADADVQAFNSGEREADVDVDRIGFGDVGYVVGGGFEWAAADPIRLRFETLYYGFDDSSEIDPEVGDAGDFAEFDGAWVVRFGVTYLFDNFLSGNTRKTASNRPDAVASKMAPKKVSQAKPLAREKKPRTEDDAAASKMAPTLVSQAPPLARAPQPRTEVVEPAPPREPPRTVVPASTGLDTESRLVKLKALYDKGLISDRDYYEKRRQLSPGVSAAKDDLKAAAVQVGPEKKPGEPEPAVKPDDEMVKIVLATPGTRGGEADRGNREYIMWVQRSLNQILGMDLDVDGIMGRQTRGAVRSFQTEAGIGVDGIAGPRTEDALIKAGASPPRPG
jgi:outer membrane immunogenic protein